MIFLFSANFYSPPPLQHNGKGSIVPADLGCSDRVDEAGLLEPAGAGGDTDLPAGVHHLVHDLPGEVLLLLLHRLALHVQLHVVPERLHLGREEGGTVGFRTRPQGSFYGKSYPSMVIHHMSPYYYA